MADSLRVKVTRRTAQPFPKARVALQTPDEAKAIRDGGSDPVFQETDDQGYAVLELKATAKKQLVLVVSHADPKKVGLNVPWEQNDTAYWPVRVPVEYDPATHEVDPQKMPFELMAVTTMKSTSGNITDFEVRLSRLRNIDEVVRRVLGKFICQNLDAGGFNPSPINYPSHTPTADGNLPYTYAPVPLLDSNGTIVPVTVPDPKLAGRGNLLEVALRKKPDGTEEDGFKPKCVSVYLPDEVMGLDNPPVLIHFRPTPFQDFNGRTTQLSPDYPNWMTHSMLNRMDDEKTRRAKTVPMEVDRPDLVVPPKDRPPKMVEATPYSYAAYFFEWFHRRTFEYVCDPWKIYTWAFAAGFVNQIQASGKAVGVVAPMPEPPDGGTGGYGRATEAVFMAELIREALGHQILVKLAFSDIDKTIGPAPEPGVMAAVGFSSGNGIFATFVQNVLAASASNVIRKNLKELYMLDPPDVQGALAASFAFLDTLKRTDGAVRCYTHHLSVGGRFQDIHAALYSPSDKPAFDDTSERVTDASKLTGSPDHRTAGTLPETSNAWPQKPNPKDPAGWVHVHSYIYSTMVCHALKQSSFPNRT
jgi:hypothetical protein